VSERYEREAQRQSMKQRKAIETHKRGIYNDRKKKDTPRESKRRETDGKRDAKRFFYFQFIYYALYNTM
jgi:hypothetical protein